MLYSFSAAEILTSTLSDNPDRQVSAPVPKSPTGCTSVQANWNILSSGCLHEYGHLCFTVYGAMWVQFASLVKWGRALQAKLAKLDSD